MRQTASREPKYAFAGFLACTANLLIAFGSRRDQRSVYVLEMKGRSMFDAACWIRSLRQMGEGGTACCRAGGSRGGEAVMRGHWACIFECSA